MGVRGPPREGAGESVRFSELRGLRNANLLTDVFLQPDLSGRRPSSKRALTYAPSASSTLRATRKHSSACGTPQ